MRASDVGETLGAPNRKGVVVRPYCRNIPPASISAKKHPSRKEDVIGPFLRASPGCWPVFAGFAPSREISSDRDEIVVIQEHVDEALAPSHTCIRPQVAQALGVLGIGGRAREDAFERGDDKAR